ncbi:hypothetical protein GQ55_8G106700 [Panicum hallii var. hallii]|uniref:Uncharacterized protein n=1 Tax=Panicum hallii var. hallii TaxID=1504633 RepID=A0A2T7CMG2_9POAL|nr:hypothetical protein GQ55_8G106700 [Panicum hallii var. hallii]
MAQRGFSSLLGAPPAARTKTASPPPEGIDREPTTAKQRAAKDQGAVVGQVSGERKMGDEEVGVAAKMVGKKKKNKGAPIVVHHFPFHCRPGLL